MPAAALYSSISKCTSGKGLQCFCNYLHSKGVAFLWGDSSKKAPFERFLEKMKNYVKYMDNHLYIC